MPKLVVQAARGTTAPAMADGLGATLFPELIPTRPAPSPTVLPTHPRLETNTISLAVSTIQVAI
jgi:hypothetical protein